jgi:hypothetical protein
MNTNEEHIEIGHRVKVVRRGEFYQRRGRVTKIDTISMTPFPILVAFSDGDKHFFNQHDLEVLRWSWN